MEKNELSITAVYRSMLVGSSDVFQLALNGKVKKYVIGNIVILGMLLAVSDFVGNLHTNPELQLPFDGKFAIITPLILSTAGIVTICAALIGLTMVYWAAARAFGGQGGLGLIASLIGLAAIPFWILAPFLNYTIRYASPESNTLLLYILMALPFLWSFKVVRQSLMTGQGLSMTKATIAVAAMWIFSVSSVYVFLP